MLIKNNMRNEGESQLKKKKIKYINYEFNIIRFEFDFIHFFLIEFNWTN